MGKKNRRKGEKPRRRVVAGMAEDIQLPEWAADQLLLEQQLNAALFLHNYLDYVRDGGFNVPGRTEPRRPGESDQEFDDRREGLRMQVEMQAVAGTSKDRCVDQLRDIRPSDASRVALAIVTPGQIWIRSTGYVTTPDDYRAGATALLDAMCPDDHRAKAGEVLADLIDEIASTGRSLLHENADQFPIATIHAAAAVTGWLYSQPSCVPDQTAAYVEQADWIMQLGNTLHPGARSDLPFPGTRPPSTMLRTPAPSPATAAWVRGNPDVSPLNCCSIIIDQSETDALGIDLRAEGFTKMLAGMVSDPRGNFVAHITTPNEIELIRMDDYDPHRHIQNRLMTGAFSTPHDSQWLDHATQNGLMVVVTPDLTALGDASDLEALTKCWFAPAHLVNLR